MSNAADHGATCADTPRDHRCGDTEEDQGVSWRQNSMIHSELMRAIAVYHSKSQTSGGMTDGFCVECERRWPCTTYHLAAGWNPDEDEDRWCPHMGVTL